MCTTYADLNAAACIHSGHACRAEATCLSWRCERIGRVQELTRIRPRHPVNAEAEVGAQSELR